MLEKIFFNVGTKIKGLAKTIFAIGTGLSALAFIAIFVSFINTEAPQFIFVGLLIGGLGILISYISVLALYGFGEIIERVSQIAENTYLIESQNRHSEE